jgi:hypothetical protein
LYVSLRFLQLTSSPLIESCFLFVQVSLVNRVTNEPVVVQGRERQMSAIVGVTSSTMHKITVPVGSRRQSGTLGVFAFTDLSVRQEGHYKLRFDLFEITGGEAVHRALQYSEGFHVYAAKQFPGMAQSTDFTDILKKHGIRVRVSKSIRGTGRKDPKLLQDGKFSPESCRLRINTNSRQFPYDYGESNVLLAF